MTAASQPRRQWNTQGKGGVLRDNTVLVGVELVHQLVHEGQHRVLPGGGVLAHLDHWDVGQVDQCDAIGNRYSTRAQALARTARHLPGVRIVLPPAHQVLADVLFDLQHRNQRHSL